MQVEEVKKKPVEDDEGFIFETEEGITADALVGVLASSTGVEPLRSDFQRLVMLRIRLAGLEIANTILYRGLAKSLRWRSTQDCSKASSPPPIAS